MILAAYYHPILATLFAFLALILIGIILLQRGKGVGLSGAFGGAGGHTAFGAKTGDVLTWATIIVAVVLLTFAVVLNYIFVPLTPFEEATIAPLSAPISETTSSTNENTAPESAAPVEATPTPAKQTPPPADATPTATPTTPPDAAKKPAAENPSGGDETP